MIKQSWADISLFENMFFILIFLFGSSMCSGRKGEINDMICKFHETDFILSFCFLAMVSISLIVTGSWSWIYSVRTAGEDKVDMEQQLDTTFSIWCRTFLSSPICLVLVFFLHLCLFYLFICVNVFHTLKIEIIVINYRVFFFTGPPPEKFKYRKPRLGEIRCI